jgi:hypothetical protein
VAVTFEAKRCDVDLFAWLLGDPGLGNADADGFNSNGHGGPPLRVVDQRLDVASLKLKPLDDARV